MANEHPILLVDDDPAIREFVHLVLEEEGYEVQSVPNGVVAMQRIQELTPSVILLDMHMPLMDGWEFAAAYRASDLTLVPIIVVTAAPSASQVAADVDAAGVLAKPFDIDELLALVSQYALPNN